MTLLRRVTSVHTGTDGTPWYSTHYFEYELSTIDPVLDRVVAFWQNLSASIQTDITTTVEGLTPIINDATGEITTVEADVDRVVQHEGVGDMLPPHTQGLIKWGTGVFIGGRQLQGKTYVPGLLENWNQLGKPNATVSGVMAAAAAALMASLSEQLRVFSPTHLTSAVVQSGTVSPVWAVLRSRRD